MLLLKLAFRNIFRQRRRSLLTGLSMAGGYFLCTVSISLTNGSFKNAIDLFTLDRTGHIQIHQDNYLQRPKISKSIMNPADLSDTLATNPEITYFTQRVFAPVMSYSDDKNAPASLIGIDLVREKQTSRLQDKVTDGAFINNEMNEQGIYSAMIGFRIAKTLNLGIGDEIILISQGADGSIANDIYLIGAVIGNTSSREKSNIYLPLIAAQEFLVLYNQIHQVSMLVGNDKKNRETARALQQQLDSKTGLLPNENSQLTVSPWQEVESSFYKSMQTKFRSNRFTLGIIVFLVFIGVLNTILMSVLERTREFGVLKAIGSRPSSIVLLVLMENTLLAMMSVFIGFLFVAPLIAWFATVGIQLSQATDLGGIKMDHMTGEFSFETFFLPMVVIIVSAIVVSIPPGIRAAGISPTKAMSSH